MVAGVLFLTGMAQALDRPADVDPMHWQAPPGEMTFGDDWLASEAATWPTWREAAEQVPEGQRAATRAAWRVALLETLLTRFPDAGEPRVAAHTELADLYRELGALEARRRHLWQALEHDAATDEVRRETVTALLEDGDELEPAAAHVAAMVRAGTLAGDDSLVAAAAEALGQRRLAQHRFYEALHPWAELDVEPGLAHQARVMAAAGFAERAIGLYARMAENGQGDTGPVAGLEELRDRVTRPRMTAVDPRLEMRWRALSTGEGGAELVDELLAGTDARDGLVRVGESRYVALWVEVARWLRERADAAARTTLSDEAASTEPRDEAMDEMAVMRQFRSQPMSSEVQQALLAVADRQLREGQWALAGRSLADVANHAVDPAVRERAARGLALVRAMREEAAASTGEGAGDGGEASAVRWLTLPAIDWWPLEDVNATSRTWLQSRREADPIPPALQRWFGVPGPVVTSAAGRYIVSGVGGVAVYDPMALDEPLWLREPRTRPARAGNLIQPSMRATDYELAPALPVKVAVANDTIYLRWGRLREWSAPGHVAAFDLHSGALRWSSQDQPEWADLLPISDPTVSEGRVYTLARRGDMAAMTWQVLVLCQDAATGETLWQRTLATDFGQLAYGFEGHDVTMDISQYGNPPLVHEGAVYCSTNMSLVARLDARDGMVEWLRPYARAAGGDWKAIAARQGARPMVVDDAVVFLPRDRYGVLALEKDSGELLWDQPVLPSRQSVGVSEGRVILADHHAAVAVEAATGDLVWEHRFNSSLAVPPVLVGESVLAVTEDQRRHVLAADTGAATHDLPPLPHTPTTWIADAPGRGLVALTPDVYGPARLRRRAIDDIAAPPGSMTNGVPRQLTPVADMIASNARVIVPPDLDENERLAYLLSGNVLHAIDVTTSTPEVRWHRVLASNRQAFDISGRPHRHRGTHDATNNWEQGLWHDDLLIIGYPHELLALDRETGVVRWRCPLPFEPDRWTISGRYLVMKGWWWTAEVERPAMVAVINIDTGTLLWQRDFQAVDDDQDFRLGYMTAVDDTLFLLSETTDGGDLEVNLLTGEIHRIRQADRRHAEGALRTAVAGQYYYGLTDSGELYEVDLVGDRAPTRFAYDSNIDDSWGFTQVHPMGRWIQVRQPGSSGDASFSAVTYDRQNPEAEPYGDRDTAGHGGRETLIEDDTLFVLDGLAIHAVDLPTMRQEQTYVIPVQPLQEPPAQQQEPFAHIANVWHKDDHLVTLAGIRHDPDDSLLRPRVDVFDRATGEHVAGQWLEQTEFFNISGTVRGGEDDAWWRFSEAAWYADRLVLGTLYGLRVFQPAAAVGRDAAIESSDEPEVRYHDGTLHVRVDVPAEQVTPYRSGGWHDADGDWLELAIHADQSLARLAIGVNAEGERLVQALPVVLNDAINQAHALAMLDGETVRGHGLLNVENARVDVRHDRDDQRLIYDLAIPMPRQPSKLALAWVAWGPRADHHAVPVRAHEFGHALQGMVLVPQMMRKVSMIKTRSE